MFKTSVNARPHCPLTFLSRALERISAQTLYCQKLESVPTVCAADSMCLTVYLYSFSRNYFSKIAQSESTKPAWKQNLTRNSQSRSFKVMHFGITKKLTTDCVSPYNNAGLISIKFPKNSERNRWKLPFSTTPLSFDALSPGNLRVVKFRVMWSEMFL